MATWVRSASASTARASTARASTPRVSTPRGQHTAGQHNTGPHTSGQYATGQYAAGSTALGSRAGGSTAWVRVAQPRSGPRTGPGLSGTFRAATLDGGQAAAYQGAPGTTGSGQSPTVHHLSGLSFPAGSVAPGQNGYSERASGR